MSQFLELTATAGIFLFLRLFVPALLILLGYNYGIAPVFGLPLANLAQSILAVVLFVGIDWAIGSDA